MKPTIAPRPRLQIIRGLPGSGKTTLALRRYPHLLRLETDLYFYSKGAYRFSLYRNAEAIEWFKDEVDNLCMRDIDFVVTGVFSAHTERLDYVIKVALDYDYEVYIKTLKTQYEGVHGVPKEHFESMRAAFLPERTLRKMYVGDPSVHFGLMPTRYPLAHLAKNQK